MVIQRVTQNMITSRVRVDQDAQAAFGPAEVENVDLAAATVQLRMQEVVYQAALGATSRVIQPSLLDFLR